MQKPHVSRGKKQDRKSVARGAGEGSGYEFGYRSWGRSVSHQFGYGDSFGVVARIGDYATWISINGHVFEEYMELE